MAQLVDAREESLRRCSRFRQCAPMFQWCVLGCTALYTVHRLHIIIMLAHVSLGGDVNVSGDLIGVS